MAGSPIESTIWNKPETVQPEILNVLIKMENKGKSPQTIESVGKALRKFAKNTDINNPDAVEKYIAKLKVRNGYKRSLCNAYKTYCDYYHIQWDKPKYQNDTQMFKCPTEQKLNLIIAGSHEDLALKLRISKDCGLRPIEIVMLKARDIDTDHRSITPTTAKHGAPRAL